MKILQIGKSGWQARKVLITQTFLAASRSAAFPYENIASWKIQRPGWLVKNLHSKRAPDVSQSGDGQGIKAAAPQKIEFCYRLGRLHNLGYFFEILASKNI